MPLHWTIDSRARLLTVITEGTVRYDHAIELLEMVSAMNAHGYRRLVDARGGRSALSSEELLAICAHIRNIHQRNEVGALAIVASPSQTARFARLLGVLASADRPMKIFSQLSRARAWIDGLVLESRECASLPLSSP